MSVINLNNAIPAAPAGVTNILWQADAGVAPRNVSAYVPVFVGDDDPSSPLAPPESGAVPAPAAGDAAAGKYLKADGTWEVPSGTAGGTGATREAPAGTLNGSNAVFTLSFTPSPAASLLLFLNGVQQNPAVDYTISGATITYTVAPQASDEHIAWYTH